MPAILLNLVVTNNVHNLLGHLHLFAGLGINQSLFGGVTLGGIVIYLSLDM